MRFITSKFLSLLFLVTLPWTPFSQDTAYPELFGVGFFEESAQTGIYQLSMAGGAEIMITGVKIDPTPSNNVVEMTSKTTNVVTGTFVAPALSSANVFKSSAPDGKLQYTMPSISTLLSVPESAFSAVEVLQFQIGVSSNDGYGNIDTLACGSWWYCITQYNRAYTPILYGVNPPVSYYGSLISFYVDPKNSQDIKQSSKMPFNYASVGNSLLDFEDYYDETSTLSYNTKQQILGLVGDIIPNSTNEPTIQFDVGYAQNQDILLTHCNFDNSTCYQVKSVASIESISASQGYTNGGQLLTINGYGFVSSDVTVTVDGVDCTVVSIQINEVVCKTQSTASASTSGLYAGANGLLTKVYNYTSGYSTTTMQTLDYYTELSLHMESFQNQNTYFGRQFSGYFQAPATTNYKFYLSCDDNCVAYLSTDSDPTNKVSIATNPTYTVFRDYYSHPTQQSVWIPLVANTYYYIEVDQIQATGGEHVSMAVEIENSVPHLNSVKEIQRLQINPTNVREQTTISITNPDSGYFNVYFYASSTVKYGPYSVYASSTASQMYYAINSYFTTYWGAPCSVTLVMTDASGNVVTSMASSVTNTYTISFLKSITSVTSVKITGITAGSAAIFQAIIPSMVQKSSIPLSGSFSIICTTLEGASNVTTDISYDASIYTITNAITTACNEYRDSFEVWDGITYSYYQDGRDLFVRFTGIAEDVPQFYIQSGVASTLVGNLITYNNTSPTPFSDNIFYEPIPFELLHTHETEPQVILTLAGDPVVCASLDCSYTYIVATAEVTGFTYSGTTLTITGTSLTTSGVAVSFAEQDCAITTSTSTQIVCTISGSLVAGSWQPLVTDANGLIPLSSSVTTQEVAVTVSSISPSSALNKHGGNTLTITGTNFPASLDDGSTVSLAFADGTACTVLTTSSTSITCQTSAFATASAGTTKSLTVTINGKTDSSHSASISSTVAAVTSISPATYSPVVKTTLTITISSAYNGDFTREDFSVYLVPTKTTISTVQINVMSVDTTNYLLYVKYPGAWSDTYSISVISASYGTLDTTGITFVAEGTITSFSPTSGSIYGGTLLTITGYTFSTTATDNSIQLQDDDCYVITTDETTITCRTPLRTNPIAATAEVYVYLKAAEIATCSFGAGTCLYTYTSTNLPTLTSFATSFDTTSNTYYITFTGSNFDGDTSTVDIYVDTFLQSTVSVTASTVVAQILNMNDTSSTNISFYLASGTPAGYTQLTSISVTPALVSVTPNIGSPAGSIITANVQGVGIYTTGLTLVTDSGVAICSTITIVSYGVVECVTKAQTLASGTNVFVKYNGVTHACYNTDTSQCAYSTSTSMPAVSAVAISSDTTEITFTGTNFLISGYTAFATYDGVVSTTTVVSSDTSAYATFAKGIPLSSTGLAPTLFFNITTSSINGHYASNTQNLTNALALTASSSSAVSCSFNGGCLLSITSAGLASSLANSKGSVSVCGYPCVYSDSDSTAAIAKCAVPALSTIYSNDEYNISTTENLAGDTTFSSNSARTAALFDMDNNFGFTSTASTCFFGMGFTTGYVGVVSQVKFFMDVFVKTTYSGNLKFQGSQDNVTYTTLFTVGNEIHEGWNYYDYADGAYLKYRYYRFYGNASGACNVGEFALMGVEAINDSGSSYACSVNVTVGSVTGTLTQKVTYTSTLTPLLNLISPRYGNVEGGTVVTFTGTNFVTDTSLYSIVIDDRTCAVSSATTTEVVCTTAPRPGLFPDTSLVFFISGYGNVATQGLLYRYVNLWSLEDTWGGEFLPCTGDSIYVPAGMHLLVDVDSTPVLDLILVEGSLIFPPDTDSTHLRTLDATYIFVDEGYLEIGTEQFPYTSKLIITMHGNKYTPEIAIYGSKVLAVRNSILEMHGVPRTPTWTELETTANIGDNTITLNTDVDWVAGEIIVIASTGYDGFEAEVFAIVSVDSSVSGFPVITLNDTLYYKHYAGIETYGTDTLEMRAEVGLLTRNVIYRGDPETTGQTQFGAHIMMSSHGDESLTGKIEYIELTDVGQAFQLGRYPIHFHLIGTVSYSYVRGNSIHQTYNRAVTMHGIQYLRVIENVAYNTMGHTFFIEDAVETKNFLDGNLAIQTKRSWSLLNTDQTPASFWITHPDNIFRNNHAAGSDRYGFWFDLQVHSTGPSYDINVCPINSQLGEFDNNVAHSNGRYGLRIFHGLIPRTYPCSDLVYDPNNSTDHFWTNPIITANFTNFVGWKNGDNGAIAERMGDVRFINFTVADNLVAGIEFSLTGETEDGRASIVNAVVVGHSANCDNTTLTSPLYGIITPRTENFTVNGARFYNFDLSGMAALGSCSHCFHPASTDSGARTVTFSNLLFDSTVVQKIKYQTPYRDIFYDLDGTLTGKGAKTWTTPYWKHNDQSPCEWDDAVYNGLVCDSTVEVRRIAFDNYAPNIFMGMEMKIIPYDDDLINGMTTAEYYTYMNDTTQYSTAPFRPSLDPTNGWAMPYLTNHKYKIHWETGLDFTNMRFTLSSRWTKDDQGIYLVSNFTDVRQAVYVVTDGVNITNNTLGTITDTKWMTGDNVIYNDTATREIHVYVNGKNYSRNPVTMIGVRCVESCLASINTTVIESTIRYWSNASSWTNGTVPVAGQDVTIESGWNMVLDVPVTPLVNILEINGRLSFLDNTSIQLNANYIFVRAGQLFIGNETNPYNGTANIVLHGSKNNEYIVFTGMIEAGDKIIANTAEIKMYGKKRTGYITRLLQSANINDTKIYVEKGLDWVAGDKIGLAPTAMIHNDSDYAVVTSYDSSTGEVDLDRPLNAYHYGTTTSTQSLYQVDIRGEVFLLTRNILIQGEDVESWGCQVITSDFIEDDGTYRGGSTIMDNVEIYNCSQYDTYNAALRFDGAVSQWSSVTNSAIHNGLGWGVHFTQSSNVILQSNIVFDFINFGVNINTCTNITFDSNLISHIHKRNFTAVHTNDPQAGLGICAFIIADVCSDITVTNNIIAGSNFYGVAARGHDCDDETDSSFKNNIIHSVQGTGVTFFPIPGDAGHALCYEGSYTTVYKATEGGVFCYYTTNQVQFKNMLLIDNGFGVLQQIGTEGDDLNIIFSDSQVYGETEAQDCPYENYCDDQPEFSACIDKYGAQIPYYSQGGKAVFPTSPSELPLALIKTYASYGGYSTFSNVVFNNFKQNATWCGQKQFAIGANPEGADYHARLFISKSTFNNVDQKAMIYTFSPPITWAVIDDCGLFPCTGPQNILIKFDQIYFSGTYTPINIKKTFQIIGYNPNAINAVSTCKHYTEWNAHYCENENTGVLLFESTDVDKEKRTFSPIVVRNNATGFANTLNEFMDHEWDGFYTSQLRLSRFPSVVETFKNYEVLYSGTVPNNQRYTLDADTGDSIIQIQYSVAGAYQISTYTGSVIAGNAFNDTAGYANNLTKSQCGENRYVGISNILQFYLTAGCTIIISPLDAILGQVRLNWTLTQFYADGGTTQFIDRLSSSLGIFPSTIKIVSVYTGSVVVQFQITSPTNSSTELASIQKALTKGLKNGHIWLGAPLLDAQYQGQTITYIVTVNQTSNATKTTTTTTSSSSSKASNGGTTITVSNGTIVISNSGSDSLNATITNSNSGNGTTSNGLDPQKFLDTTKIVTIAVVLGVLLIGLVVLALCLYRRSKRTPAYTRKQQEDASPDQIKKRKHFDHDNVVSASEYKGDNIYSHDGISSMKNNIDIVISDMDHDGIEGERGPQDNQFVDRSRSVMNDHSTNQFNTYSSINPMKDTGALVRSDKQLLESMRNPKIYPESVLNIGNSGVVNVNTEGESNTIRQFMPPKLNTSGDVDKSPLTIKNKNNPIAANWYNIKEEENQQESSIIEHQVEGNADGWK